MMVAAPFAVLMVMVVNAQTQMDRSDVGADNVCTRGARESEGEQRGDNEFHS